MRIRLQTRKTVFFLAAFVVALILFLPLRLVLGWVDVDAFGLTAREARGTVWDGTLTDAQAGSVDLGDLDAGLSPVQLLVGRARVDLDRDAGTDSFAGAVGLTRNSTGIDDLTGTVPVGNAFAPLPISALAFSDLSVRFLADACQNAEGGVRAILGGEVAGISLAQGLSGTARCDGTDLLLPLASQSGQERLELRIAGSGAWTADLVVQTGDAALIGRLAAAGFAPGQGGYRLRITGR